MRKVTEASAEVVILTSRRDVAVVHGNRNRVPIYMTYRNKMKACFQFCAKSHRGVSRGCHINIPQGCRRGTRLSEQSSDIYDLPEANESLLSICEGKSPRRQPRLSYWQPEGMPPWHTAIGTEFKYILHKKRDVLRTSPFLCKSGV